MKEKTLKLITHPLFSGSAVMVIGSNAVNAINYIYHFTIGRLLGASAYGELVSLFSLISILGMIPLALNLSITKFVSAAPDSSAIHNLVIYLQKKTVWISIMVLLLTILFAPFVSEYLKLSSSVHFILVGVIFAFSLSAFINRAVMQGVLRFPQLVFSMLIDNTFKLVGGVILIFLGWSVFGAMFALVLSGLLSVLLSFYFIRDYLKGHTFTAPAIKPFFLYSLPVFAHQLFVTSMISSDIILVKHYFDPVSAGNYSATSTLAKIIFFAASPVMSVMFPIISGRFSKGQPYVKIFLLSILMTLLITIGVALLFTFFAPMAVWMLFGKGFGSASEILPLFSLFMILLSINNLLFGFFLSVNKTLITLLGLVAALSQIILITMFHETLNEVLLVSIIVSALLTLGLFVYSIYENEACFGYSSRIQTTKNDRKRSKKNS